MNTTATPIQPGDWVEHIYKDLDAREVISVGSDFLTLDLLGQESPRLPKDNYRTVTTAEEALRSSADLDAEDSAR